MNKIDLYKLIKQQYKDYKIELNIILSTCDGCPCKTLRDEVFGPDEQTGCTDEMMYLVDKYKIDDADVFFCEGSALASVKIAKKMAERTNRI